MLTPVEHSPVDLTRVLLRHTQLGAFGVQELVGLEGESLKYI